MFDPPGSTSSGTKGAKAAKLTMQKPITPPQIPRGLPTIKISLRNHRQIPTSSHNQPLHVSTELRNLRHEPPVCLVLDREVVRGHP